jgi:tetratricopeptide (TPR) repeat protein
MRTRTGAVRTAATILTLLGTGSPLLAQHADVDEVRRVIRAETETYYRRDAEGWKRTWVQDSTAIRTFITSGSYSVALGWDRFGPGTVESLRRDPTPQPATVEWSNFVLRIDGALAWAEYDERTIMPTDSVPLVARQQRTLVKRDGEWRILSAGSFVGSSYGASPGAIEERLDRVGADLNAARKQRDAIQVLELNARLFPRSSSAHQRLAEGYAAAGDARRAVESHERALAIDPTNASSKAALAALRARRAP